MATTDRPNVIVFFTDQQRWDTAGVHGNPAGLTPNFDRMALAGTHLFNSFTCQPVCGPARSCLQTGRYATETGVWRNGPALLDGMPTLAGLFGAAGYRTGYIGKWHLSTAGPGPVPVEQRGGYRDWLASNVLEFTSDAYRTRMFDAAGNPVDLPGYRVDALADAAIRYLDARSCEPQPFFLFLSFIEPHHQNHRDDYPAPTGYEEAYTGTWVPPDLQALGGSAWRHLPGYYGMVKRLDEALGRIQDALRSLDLARSTVVLYSADHGCHFKTRNGEYKRSCHDSSIRLPTALSGPGFDGGGRVQQLTSLIDVPRTLLDAAAITPPDAMRGVLGVAAADRPRRARRLAGRRVHPDQREPGGPRAAHRALEVRGDGAGDRRHRAAGGGPVPGAVSVRPGGGSLRTAQPGRTRLARRGGAPSAAAPAAPPARGGRVRAGDRAGACAAARPTAGGGRGIGGPVARRPRQRLLRHPREVEDRAIPC